MIEIRNNEDLKAKEQWEKQAKIDLLLVSVNNATKLKKMIASKAFLYLFIVIIILPFSLFIYPLYTCYSKQT